VGSRIVKLVLAYDGTDFHGWARQRDPQVRTIEGVVAEGLAHILGEEPRLSVAGRTDAGVHARGQVTSFVTSSRVPPSGIQAGLNGRLAPEIVVIRAVVAPDGFDARFSATARHYRYVVDTAGLADPFTARFVWHRPGELAIGPMRTAAFELLGTRDFRSFCRHPGGDRSTVRHLQRVAISRHSDLVVLRFRADAFLHQMVRSLVGTLVAVGEGKLAPDRMEGILEARDRAAAGPVAPPRGLTLDKVIYGSPIGSEL
jgi:tRNA pseudouridine38-40 synthase